MSVKFLYYTEDTEKGGYLSSANSIPFLDQMTLMYGGEHICIHPSDATYIATSTEQHNTLAEAQSAYPSQLVGMV